MLGRDFARTQANNTCSAMAERCHDSAAAISGFGRTTRSAIGPIQKSLALQRFLPDSEGQQTCVEHGHKDRS